MRAVVQRVSRAQVTVAGEIVGRIGRGFLVLLGIGADDTATDVNDMVQKIIGLRVFEDEQGKMNLSLAEVGGQCLLVSQFTLYGDCRKGRRPSFVQAAPPDLAVDLYQQAITLFKAAGVHVETGRFREHMDVELVNDGPVTLLLDSRKVF